MFWGAEGHAPPRISRGQTSAPCLGPKGHPMPETMIVQTFLFEELSDSAKERARAWWRESRDSHDMDHVVDDFITIAEMLGVEIATRPVRLYGGGTRQEPKVWWSHFYCQGQGACFEGTYRYKKGALAEVKAYAPKDEALHRIACALQDIQKANFYQLRAKIGHSGPYHHAYSMDIEVTRESDTYQDMTEGAEEAVIEALRDLANWLLRQLLAEDEYQNSDEYVDEAITINEYRFTEDGRRCAPVG